MNKQTLQSNNSNFDLLKCNEDRDPISMNIFWEDINGIKKQVYPSDNFDQLVFYYDAKNILRCFEKESLKYLKTYNIINHPISTDPIPPEILETLCSYNIEHFQDAKTTKNLALDVFQYFSKISIFIDHELFLNLNKQNLIKFNYELRDFWQQNFTNSQKLVISPNIMFEKSDDMLNDCDLENIQKYLLNELKVLLQCEKEEYKYMINYIVLGALGIVIPEIKIMYPDFSFSFTN